MVHALDAASRSTGARMKPLLPLLTVAALMTGCQVGRVVPATAPALPQEPQKVYIHVSDGELNRALDEAELMRLLWQDWLSMDVKHGNINIANRKRIAVLMKRIASEP